MDIIITGCSKGIGFELLKLSASDPNNRIIAISRDISSIEDFIHKSKATQITALAIDLTADGFEKEIVRVINTLNFRPNILINNAGSLINKSFENLTSDDFDHMFNVNIKAPFLLIQHLLPYFSSNSHIVNIGSMGGFQGSAKFAGLSLYSASKAALANFTECLAEELKHKKIAVNCLALGAAQTEMLQEAFPGYIAPISASSMANYIHQFAMTGHEFYNGKVLPVSLSTP
ncbi:MAG: SDR family oxidoreductase [Ignavibacteria bacterium]|nr:SDR family oxidoreductase [Ignavibacteria bacterium]